MQKWGAHAGVHVHVYLCTHVRVFPRVGKRGRTELKHEPRRILHLERLTMAAPVLTFLLQRHCWGSLRVFWDLVLKQMPVYFFHLQKKWPRAEKSRESGKSRGPLVRNPAHRTQKQRNILYKLQKVLSLTLKMYFSEEAECICSGIPLQENDASSWNRT